MMRRTIMGFGIVALALPGAAKAKEQGHGQGHGQGQGQGQGQGRGRGEGRGNGHNRGGGGSLGGPELVIIQQWLRTNPGFNARPLPPGMRNRLEQGKPLPPGLARRGLPAGLLGQLPPRAGYNYAYVGA